MGNFILIGTLQALFFTSVYAGGNLMILGINPFKMSDSFQEDSEFVQASSSVIVLKGLKYLGLSQETLDMIEKDIKNKDKQAEEAKEKEDKKVV